MDSLGFLHGGGWKATVLEVKGDGAQDAVGIDATGETRGAADDAAERKLRRLLPVALNGRLRDQGRLTMRGAASQAMPMLSR